MPMVTVTNISTIKILIAVPVAFNFGTNNKLSMIENIAAKESINEKIFLNPKLSIIWTPKILLSKANKGKKDIIFNKGMDAKYCWPSINFTMSSDIIKIKQQNKNVTEPL